MKVLIRENCSYREDAFKQDDIVEIGEETAKVLLHFNYAKQIENDDSNEKDNVKPVSKKAKQASNEKVSDV